ncbi:MAG: methylenetetrahydrofolate--tRNA-(uracil(54)-C(5))-methyltransferase (FADH(2)-oxidizing) TrmFO [Candidatus Eremiobacterota bacterium]
MNSLTVIGGGLAGSEASWQAAERGIKVRLFEMRPERMTPAHRTGKLAELVCSNSLRSDSIDTASGLLKEELRRFNSIIMKCADNSRVDAGSALAVDREVFASLVEKAVEGHKNITVERKELHEIPDGVVIVATGPLTSPSMAEAIKKLLGEEHLYFYDAVAPIIAAESIDFEKVFRASRYDTSEGDYLNCPMTEAEYRRFYMALMEAEKMPLHDFEEEKYFEGCLPVEEIARRGEDSLRFGPLKPVGLVNPAKPQEEPFAVLQLRAENKELTMYNMVGFQTRLKWEEQKKVFQLIPGLEKAEFYRFGVMHRNTFINGPCHLNETWSLKSDTRILFAGQITGVEGYLESCSSGLMAGINASLVLQGRDPLVFPGDSALGSLARHISHGESKNFQPMKMNFGLFRPLESEKKIKKKLKRALMVERALSEIEKFKGEVESEAVIRDQ